MQAKDHELLHRIFHAKSLAIIGASLDTTKFGGLFLKAVLDFGFKGTLYPVNPQGGQIRGIRFLRDIAELPYGIDLAALCVPREYVISALEACLEKGIAGAEILTAGFKEADDTIGPRLEDEIGRIAAKGIRIIGPNCFGIYCPGSGLTILPGNEFSRQSGPVGFISQSGGICADLGQIAKGDGIDFSVMVSYGNGCDLNAPELLEYLTVDPDTRIIGAYIEGVIDGRALLRSLSGATRHKPVVMWKAGFGEAGTRAASSHTGSLAADESVWSAVMRQANAIPADGLEDLVDKIMMFLCLEPAPSDINTIR